MKPAGLARRRSAPTEQEFLSFIIVAILFHCHILFALVVFVVARPLLTAVIRFPSILHDLICRIGALCRGGAGGRGVKDALLQLRLLDIGGARRDWNLEGSVQLGDEI